MHVHLPKPLHGWRAFVGEVGIIVIGVLIALGFEQVVESMRWHERAAAARERLHAEIGHEYLIAEERLMVEGCLDKQLDRIEKVLLSSNGTLAALPVEREDDFTYVYRWPSRSWADSAWQSVITEGVSPYLNDKERELLPIHYNQIQRIRDDNADEDKAAGDLLALARPLPLDPMVRSTFVRTIEAERLRNELMAEMAKQINERIEQLGYRPTAAKRKQWIAHSGTIKFCRAHQLPLGKIELQG